MRSRVMGCFSWAWPKVSPMPCSMWRPPSWQSADVVRLWLGHLAEDGLADLHRHLVELLLAAPGTGVAGAALHGIDRGVGHEFERLARLLADVLDARMAGDVIGDLAQGPLEVVLRRPSFWRATRYSNGSNIASAPP